MVVSFLLSKRLGLSAGGAVGGVLLLRATVKLFKVCERTQFIFKLGGTLPTEPLDK